MFVCKNSFQKNRASCNSLLFFISYWHHVTTWVEMGLLPWECLCVFPGVQYFWVQAKPVPSVTLAGVPAFPFGCHSRQAGLCPPHASHPALLSQLSAWLTSPPTQNCKIKLLLEIKCVWIMFWNSWQRSKCSLVYWIQVSYRMSPRSPGLTAFTEPQSFHSVVDECLYLEGDIFKNRNANVCPWF